MSAGMPAVFSELYFVNTASKNSKRKSQPKRKVKSDDGKTITCDVCGKVMNYDSIRWTKINNIYHCRVCMLAEIDNWKRENDDSGKA